MLIRALNAYCHLPNQGRVSGFCRQNFLSHTALKMIVGIRKQLFLEMRRLHLVPSEYVSSEDPDLNLYSHSWPVVQGAVVAGCYPGVAFVRSGTKLRKIRTYTNSMASLHPSSSLRRQVQTPKKQGEPGFEYLAYQELSKLDEGLTLRTVTAVPPLTVALFAGPIRMSRVIAEDFELGKLSAEPTVPFQPRKTTRRKTLSRIRSPSLSSGHPKRTFSTLRDGSITWSSTLGSASRATSRTCS